MQNIRLMSLAALLWLPLLAFGAYDEQEWLKKIKPEYIGDKTLIESSDIIKMETPYRAEDPDLVPLNITALIPQTPERYIKRILVLIDNNPLPFAAEFGLSPDSGKADLSMRVRFNTYSFVRAIAELNNGELHMVKQFVKASGGCSAPIAPDTDAAMQRLGKMKFKLPEPIKAGEPNVLQLLISHPNITGMQMDQVTRFIKKSHFVDKVDITYNDKALLSIKSDIAIGSDPNFRFYFVPKAPGVLKAEMSDTSCESPNSRKVCSQGKHYSQSQDVKF